jgi:hypothetical protein
LLIRPLAGKTDELVGLYSHDRTKPDSYRGFSYPNYVDVRDRNDVFEAVMAHTFSMVGVPAGDGIRQTFVDVVTANYFDTLGVRLSAGRAFTLDEERPGSRIPVAIVRNERAALLGKTIKVNGLDLTVVGVAPPGFTGTMALITPEMWLPTGLYHVVVNDLFKKGSLTDRQNLSLVVAGRLKPGLSLQTAAPRLDVFSRQLERAYPDANKDQLLTVNPLPRLGTSTSPQSERQPAIASAFLMALSSVVLLIACLNIANMLLARGRCAAERDCYPPRRWRRTRTDRAPAADRRSPARLRRRGGRSVARDVGNRRAGRLVGRRHAARDRVPRAAGSADPRRHHGARGARDGGLGARPRVEDLADESG